MGDISFFADYGARVQNARGPSWAIRWATWWMMPTSRQTTEQQNKQIEVLRDEG